MRIKINNTEYKVQIVKENDEHLKMEDGYYHFGVCDMKYKVIYIMEKLPEGTLDYVIKHEIVHAYIDSYGFLQVNYTDEIIADFIATYMENIDRDYFKVYKYYIKEEFDWKDKK